jgi:hypothetical protein
VLSFLYYGKVWIGVEGGRRNALVIPPFRQSVESEGHRRPGL